MTYLRRRTPAWVAAISSGVHANATIVNGNDADACLVQEDEIMKLGMGAYMGVAQGAVFPPKFIHLTYK